MKRYNDKQKVVRYYDAVSPYFSSLWGPHLHHGYWIRGDESKETAQTQLAEHLAQAAAIRPHCAILDVGCGFGGSSIYLAKQYQAEVTGITISPIQVDMATQAAAREHLNAAFLLMDAEAMAFDRRFDVIWSVESISHYQHKAKFFASAARLLQPQGTLAIVDWFAKPDLPAAERRKFLQPIEKGMLVELQTMDDYQQLLRAQGLQIARSEVLNAHCAKTWELGSEIIKNKALWRLAASNGVLFLNFLRSFTAMRAGFASGNFIYGLLVARSPAA